MRRLFLISLILALAFGLAAADNALQLQEKDKAGNAPGSGEMLLGRGGPDAFGYTWVDSDEPDGPLFNWIDITTNGTEITPWPHGSVDDGWSDPIAMGLTFNFYGTNYSNISVATNGYISFLALTGSVYSNVAIPATATPNAFIGVEWDDLDGGTVGHCYYYHDATGNRFIVSWVGWPYYIFGGEEDPHDIQVILDADDNSIVTQYRNGADWHASATIGIENAAGSDGLQVVFNQAYARNDLATRFALLTEFPNIGVVPSSISGTAPEGLTDRDTLTITNTGTAALIVNLSADLNRAAAISFPPTQSTPDMEINSNMTGIDNPNDPPVILDIFCPGGSLFGQDPTVSTDSWTFGVSDAERNLIRFESLTGTNARVTEIRLWGVDLYHNGSNWVECNEDPADIQIIFYADAGGTPGAPIATRDVTISGTPTGGTFQIPGGASAIQKEYRAPITPPVTIFGGWVSVQGTGSGDNCWFMWQNSLTGDGSSLLFDGANMTPQPFDLALCIIGTVATPWLTVNPASLNIPAGGSATAEVIMNATGQPVGTLNGGIILQSNDPDQPSITVPVTFVVTPNTGVYDDASGLPTEFTLAQNYPNPFNPTTEIEFGLPVRSAVSLEVFNLLGQRVKTLVDAELEAGYRTVVWDGTNDAGAQLSSGTYFYILRVEGDALAKKMIMIK